MNFVNPYLLFGLGFIAIPIIIHLIFRKQIKEIIFPSLIILKKLNKKKTTYFNFRDLLILLLRILIIVLIVLMLSHPRRVVEESIPSMPGLPASKIIIIDNSYTQEGLLDYHKNAAVSIVKSSKTYDEYIVISTSMDNNILTSQVFSSNRDVILDKINDIELDYHPKNLQLVFESVFKKFESAVNDNKSAIFISTLNDASWNRLNIDAIKEYDKNVSINLINPLNLFKKENNYISKVNISSEIVNIDEKVRFEITVKNSSLNEVLKKSKLVLEFYLEDEKVTRSILFLKPNNIVEKTFEYTFTEPGVFKGYFHIIDGNIDKDDYFYFTIKVLDKPKICIVDDATAISIYKKDGYYLLEAFENADYLTSYTLERRDISNYNILFLVDIVNINETIAKKLYNYLLKGGNILFFAGEKLDVKKFNKEFAAIPYKISPVELFERVESENIQIINPDYSDTDRHPVLQVFKNKSDGNFKSILVKAYLKSRITQDESLFAVEDNKLYSSPEILLRFNNSDPALVLRKIGQGYSGIFTITANRDWSDFATRTLFVPVMNQLVKYFIGRLTIEKYNSYYMLNEPIEYKIDTKDNIRKFNVTSSDKKINQVLSSVWQEKSYYLIFSKTDIPGYYYIKGRDDGTFAVNIYPEDSDIIEVSLDKFIQIFKDSNIVFQMADKTRSISGTESGKFTLWKIILVVVILIIIVEGWVTR